MSIAIYPGSFDPPTLGHLDVIRRASVRFSELVVCIMHNGAKSKSLFSCQERQELLQETTKDIPNVTVETFDGLLTDYITRFDFPVVIRGLRAVTDFDYEFQMAAVNRKLNPDIETLFMVASDKYTFLSSSVVRELGAYDADLLSFVPEPVAQAVRRKLCAGAHNT